MKKNLEIALLIIVIITASYFIFKNSNKKEEVEVLNTEKVSTQAEGLIVADSFEIKILNPVNDYVAFDIKYPSFKNSTSDFNLQIENLIKTSMDEHIKASQEYWQARIDTQQKGENISKIPSKEDKLSFFSNIIVIQSNSNYISFILKYGGFSGGAHGYETDVSFNYDVKNKKTITLKDLFPNDPQYLTTLSNISREYLKKQFATVTEEDKKNSSPEALKEYVDNMVSMIEAGTEPKEENFSVFTFTPDKIKIYFADYQVGPHSIGMPEIEIDRK